MAKTILEILDGDNNIIVMSRSEIMPGASYDYHKSILYTWDGFLTITKWEEEGTDPGDYHLYPSGRYLDTDELQLEKPPIDGFNSAKQYAQAWANK